KINKENQQWQIDLIGPLPSSESEKRYILTVVDVFSRYMQARALETKSEKEVLCKLEEILCENHEQPKEIRSDNGLEFKNKRASELANKYKIEWKYSSPYHPETNGSIERHNGKLLTKLKKLTDFGEIDWEQKLKPAIDAVNLSHSRAIEKTPYEVKFGKKPFLKIDADLNLPPPKKLSKSKLDKQINDSLDKYRKTYGSVKEYVQKFKPNDKIWYWSPSRIIGKLEPKWNSEGIIVSAKNKSYVIELKNGKRYIAAESHLKHRKGF
ncbi:MAG: integrase catalytic domain-containing protein, partial [Aeromonas sp.]